MTGILMRLGVLAAVVAAFAILAGSSQQPAAEANPLTVRVFNPSICVAVGGAPALQCALNGGRGTEYHGSVGGTRLHDVAQALRGDSFGPRVLPSDFDSVDELSGRQIHQLGNDPTVFPTNPSAAPNNLAKLTVVAFVDSDAPVTFRTTAGRWMVNNSQVWECNRPDGAGASSNIDSDCGGGSQTQLLTQERTHEDGAVVAVLGCSLATCPNRGTERIDIIQNNIVFPVEITVVGEAHSIEFFTLEDTMQAGVPDDPATGEPACPFQATLEFITASLAQAEKTVVVARALDIDRNQITGSWFTWLTDEEQMVAAQPVTPTLNLGAFGFGAPNILCAVRDATPGETDLTVRMTRRLTLGNLHVDTMAAWWIKPLGEDQDDLRLPTKSVTYNILGLPEGLELTVDPPQIVCDGNNTATVTAQVRDAEGNAATSGVDVRFDVTILGTANPITTRTNGEGVATSVVTPLSQQTAGTTAVVTVESTGVQENILIGCVAGVGEEPVDPTAPPVDGEPVGITPPATGVGALGQDGGALSWWPALALLAGAIGLGGARLAMRRA